MDQKINFYDTRFIMFEDYYVVDLWDFLFRENSSIENYVNELKKQHGAISKATYFPIKLFDIILGERNGVFDNIGETNWPKLLPIHENYPKFYAFIRNKNNEKQLIATSVDGIIWSFNVIDA